MEQVAKKCLLIGINYEGMRSALSGCINDSENMKALLIRQNLFCEKDMIMMNDHSEGELYPTKENIIKQLDGLVQFALENSDKKVDLFIAYSGHGASVKDASGDEDDKRDEALCPIDCDVNGYILDDDIRKNFIDRLGENVKLFMFVDACHSGTMLDLRYLYTCGASNYTCTYRSNEDTKCKVVSISGCRDNQTSADTWEYDRYERKNEAQGALTASFIECYRPGITYFHLINNIRSWLKNRYDQIPQLTSGKPLNINFGIDL